MTGGSRRAAQGAALKNWQLACGVFHDPRRGARARCPSSIPPPFKPTHPPLTPYTPTHSPPVRNMLQPMMGMRKLEVLEMNLKSRCRWKRV